MQLRSYAPILNIQVEVDILAFKGKRKHKKNIFK